MLDKSKNGDRFLGEEYEAMIVAEELSKLGLRSLIFP